MAGGKWAKCNIQTHSHTNFHLQLYVCIRWRSICVNVCMCVCVWCCEVRQVSFNLSCSIFFDQQFLIRLWLESAFVRVCIYESMRVFRLILQITRLDSTAHSHTLKPLAR